MIPLCKEEVRVKISLYFCKKNHRSGEQKLIRLLFLRMGNNTVEWKGE